MSLNREFERTAGLYTEAKYPDIAEFLRLQKTAIQMYIAARGAPVSLFAIGDETDSKFTLPRVQSQQDLVFTLQDLRDPEKTEGILTALYKNQFGENLGRLQVRSLNIIIQNSGRYRDRDSGEVKHVDLSTLELMRISEDGLFSIINVGRKSIDIFAAATHPLREALEIAELLPHDLLNP